MAEPSSVAEQDLWALASQLTCGICLDIYEGPKLLQCLHVYCNECLEHLAFRHQSLRCPDCHTSTLLPPSGVSGLPPAFLMCRWLLIYDILWKLKEQRLRCMECGEGFSSSRYMTSYCHDCGEILCNMCTHIHKRWAVRSTHEVINLHQLKAQHVCLKKYCSKHNTTALDLYCETCEEVICRDCIVRVHRDHQYDLITDAYPKHRNVITDHLQPIEQKLREVDGAIESLDTLHQQIMDQTAEIQDCIHTSIRQLLEALEERKTELMKQLNQVNKKKTKILAAQRDKLEFFKIRLASCLEYVNESLRICSPAEILSMPLVQYIEKMTAEFKTETFVPTGDVQADLKFTAPECSHFGQLCADSPNATSKGLEHKKESTQASTDSRGYPPTTMTEGLSCLRGVDEIIDEIEFVLPDEAPPYKWMNSGFRLDVPHGALPAGATPCRISVKASLSGQFEFPDNSELVSAVYWISTPKNLRFSKPLTVYIQHCGTVENQDDPDLSFVVAKCTQSDLPYKFKFLDGGLFVPNSSYGSISVTHFSGLAIVSKKRKSQSYCARTYVANRRKDEWRVHFVILRNLDIVLKAVNTHYSCFAERDATLKIDFEQSEISLDIPRKGQLTDEGWKILPQSHPSISKRDADRFRSSDQEMIPECVLIVLWERSGQHPVRFLHEVSLIGAKKPNTYFNITINPELEEPPPLSPPPLSPPPLSPPPLSPPSLQQTYQEHTRKEFHVRYPAGLADQPQLSDLMNEVAAKIPSKWRQFGIELRLTPDELDGFLIASIGDTLRCFSSVFTVWKKKMSREPYSWQTVVESLRAPAVGEHRLALELTNKLTRT